MSKSDSRLTVLETINEVRRLLGFSTVTKINADKHSLILLRLLNGLMTEISDYGDWQEMFNTTTVTATTSVARYSLGISQPLKRIYEISFSTDSRALDLITIERFNQYSRNGGTGRPRFFTLKQVDDQGVPFFHVFKQPGSNENGLTFSIDYYLAPRLYDNSSGEEEIPFPANVVIQGLYAKGLLEQLGNTATTETILATQLFTSMMDEALDRYTTDTGTDIYLTPRRGR